MIGHSRSLSGLLNFSAHWGPLGLAWGGGMGRGVVGRGGEGVAMAWAAAPEVREQMVLFATSLDEVIPEDHLVRQVARSTEPPLPNEG